MKCNNCGKEIPDDAMFCGYCGQNLHRLVEDQPIRGESNSVAVIQKGSGAAKVLKTIAQILMGLSAAYVPLTSLMGVDYTNPEFYFFPIIIIGLMILAVKLPILSGIILLVPTFWFFAFFLFSLPLLIASILLIISGILTGRRKR